MSDLSSPCEGYFAGASTLHDLLALKKKNSNPHPEPSEEVKDILKQRLKLDIEFYSFVLQRLLNIHTYHKMLLSRGR